MQRGNGRLRARLKIAFCQMCGPQSGRAEGGNELSNMLRVIGLKWVASFLLTGCQGTVTNIPKAEAFDPYAFCFSPSATTAARAMEFTLVSKVSERLVRMAGTLVPVRMQPFFTPGTVCTRAL